MGTYTKLLQLDKKQVKPKTSSKPSAAKEQSPPKKQSKKKAKTVVSRNHGTMTPRHHGTTVSRYHDTTTEAIRKAVKQIGKEAATHRYTEAEKKAIANIVFTYRNQGIFTSENEISRIAINFVIEDFEQNGEESILAKCLKALND